MASIQICYWLNQRWFARLRLGQNPLLGHLILFLSRLNFIFAGSLFSAVCLVRFNEWASWPAADLLSLCTIPGLVTLRANIGTVSCLQESRPAWRPSRAQPWDGTSMCARTAAPKKAIASDPGCSSYGRGLAGRFLDVDAKLMAHGRQILRCTHVVASNGLVF